MFVGCLLQSQGFAPLGGVFEVTIVTESGVLNRTENCKLVLVVTEFDLLVLNYIVVCMSTYCWAELVNPFHFLI